MIRFRNVRAVFRRAWAHKLRQPAMAAILSLACAVMIVACQSSGGGTFRVEEDVMGTRVRSKVRVKWGPAEKQPDGATRRCVVSINGEEIEVWQKDGPPTEQWFHEPGTDEWNRLIGGRMSCLGERDGGDQPVGRPSPGIHGETTAPMFYAIDTDEKNDLGRFTFVFPAGSTIVNPANPGDGDPIDLVFGTTTTPTGEIVVQIGGSLNEVAKWCLYQGITQFTVRMNGMTVNVNVVYDYSVVTLTDGDGRLISNTLLKPEGLRNVTAITWNPLRR